MNKPILLKQNKWSIAVLTIAFVLFAILWKLENVSMLRIFAFIGIVLLVTLALRQSRLLQGRVSQLSSKVNIDQLTQLVNRLGIEPHLEKAAAEAVRGRGCSAFFLDLDSFKKINDTYGHESGDQVLRVTATRLLSCVRGYDTVARIGADEFVIVLPGLTEISAIMALAARIISSVNQNISVNGHEVQVGISIGITSVNKLAIAPRDLLRHAEVALSRAKSSSGNNYCFYEPAMDSERERRKMVEADLSVALQKKQLEIYYQPIIGLKHNAVTCFEALIRWNHPERGQVPPSEFIELAEQTGLINDIGAWVLKQACSDVLKISNTARVAVNISAVQLRNPTFAAHVIQALAVSGLPAQRLELEVTESVIMKDSERAFALLRHLKSLGLRVALDDFGIGFSSLSYLKTFEFDKIKIDRSFILNVERNRETKIIQAITGLGTSLGMITTVEGVESEAQLQRAIELGCDEVQGYYYSKPKPMAELMVERSKRPTQLQSIA